MIRSLAFGFLCAAAAAGATAYLLADPVASEHVDHAMHTSAEAVTRLTEQVTTVPAPESPVSFSAPAAPPVRARAEPAPAAAVHRPVANTDLAPDYDAMARQLQSLSDRLEAFTERIHEQTPPATPTR